MNVAYLKDVAVVVVHLRTTHRAVKQGEDTNATG
jgi:hypothetical protein